MKRWPIDQFKRLFHFTRKHRPGLLISGLVCVVSLGLYVEVYLAAHPSPTLSFLSTIELRTLDMRFQLRGVRDHDGKVVIVAIDQKSQDVLGRWPFPRSNFATMTDVLREAGARVIAFDVNFPQPDQNSALQALRQVRGDYDKSARAGTRSPAFDTQLKALETEADNDKKFAEALSRCENVILGYFFFFDDKEAKTQNKERLNEFLNFLSFQAYPQIINPQFTSKFEEDRPVTQPSGLRQLCKKLRLLQRHPRPGWCGAKGAGDGSIWGELLSFFGCSVLSRLYEPAAGSGQRVLQLQWPRAHRHRPPFDSHRSSGICPD
jgi:hypothetical protein